MAGPTQAKALSIACAANFTATMQELVALYEIESGVTITCTFGSTGMLYGQIKNGAPYDLFFAADMKRPQLLFDEGYSLPPAPYAKGRVVAWSANKTLASAPDWKEAVTADVVQRVGMANPNTAPYGLRAEEALIEVGLIDSITPKLVFGKNVGAAFQYAYSGATTVSFVALSQALSSKGTEGVYWPIPEAHPIEQAACILKTGKTHLALALLEWLKTSTAQTVIKRYGYE